MGRKILLADDSVTIQKVVELTFMDQDFEVLAVSDGDAALTRFDEWGPDLVIADVHMPGANGYDVCREAKSRRPGLPVLLLVGTFEPFDEGDAEAAGADRFLKKPFDSQQLLAMAGELLAATPSEPEPVEEAEVEEAEVEEAGLELESEVSADDDVALDADFSDAFTFEDQEPAEVEVESSPQEDLLSAEPTEAADAPDEEEGAEAAFAIGLDEEESPVRTDEDQEVEALDFDADQLEDLAEPEPEAEEPEAAAEPEPEAEEPEAAAEPEPDVDDLEVTRSANGLTEDDVDRIARRVVQLMSETTIRDVAWDILPDLAEVVIRERLRELESQLE